MADLPNISNVAAIMATPEVDNSTKARLPSMAANNADFVGAIGPTYMASPRMNRVNATPENTTGTNGNQFPLNQYSQAVKSQTSELQARELVINATGMVKIEGGEFDKTRKDDGTVRELRSMSEAFKGSLQRGTQRDPASDLQREVMRRIFPEVDKLAKKGTLTPGDLLTARPDTAYTKGLDPNEMMKLTKLMVAGGFSGGGVDMTDPRTSRGVTTRKAKYVGEMADVMSYGSHVFGTKDPNDIMQMMNEMRIGDGAVQRSDPAVLKERLAQIAIMSQKGNTSPENIVSGVLQSQRVLDATTGRTVDQVTGKKESGLGFAGSAQIEQLARAMAAAKGSRNDPEQISRLRNNTAVNVSRYMRSTQGADMSWLMWAKNQGQVSDETYADILGRAKTSTPADLQQYMTKRLGSLYDPVENRLNAQYYQQTLTPDQQKELVNTSQIAQSNEKRFKTNEIAVERSRSSYDRLLAKSGTTVEKEYGRLEEERKASIIGGNRKLVLDTFESGDERKKLNRYITEEGNIYKGLQAAAKGPDKNIADKAKRVLGDANKLDYSTRVGVTILDNIARLAGDDNTKNLEYRKIFNEKLAQEAAGGPKASLAFTKAVGLSEDETAGFLSSVKAAETQTVSDDRNLTEREKRMQRAVRGGAGWLGEKEQIVGSKVEGAVDKITLGADRFRWASNIRARNAQIRTWFGLESKGEVARAKDSAIAALEGIGPGGIAYEKYGLTAEDMTSMKEQTAKAESADKVRRIISKQILSSKTIPDRLKRQYVKEFTENYDTDADIRARQEEATSVKNQAEQAAMETAAATGTEYKPGEAKAEYAGGGISGAIKRAFGLETQAPVKMTGELRLINPDGSWQPAILDGDGVKE